MQNLILFLSQFQGIEFYVLLTFALVASGCYFPISSDLTIITITGLSAATGLYHIPTVFLCVLIGILTGDIINFSIAKKFGPALLKKPRMQRIFKPERVERMTQYLQKSGTEFIFFVRFMPSLRTILFFSAGIMQVSTWKFILYNGLSTNMYLAILMLLSYHVGTDFMKLSSLIFQFQISFSILVLVFASILIYKRIHISKD